MLKELENDVDVRKETLEQLIKTKSKLKNELDRQISVMLYLKLILKTYIFNFKIKKKLNIKYS